MEFLPAEPGWSVALVDPPYVETTVNYGPTFDWMDHGKLQLELLKTKRPWLLTYDDHEMIRTLYDTAPYRMTTRQVQRKRRKDKTVTELWILSPENYNVWPTETVKMTALDA